MIGGDINGHEGSEKVEYVFSERDDAEKSFGFWSSYKFAIINIYFRKRAFVHYITYKSEEIDCRLVILLSRETV